jgi:hypothetical protein
LKEKAFIEDADFLRSYSDPVLCEDLLLCHYGDKTLEYDPFLMREKLLLGEKDENGMLHLLESGYFRIIQLNKKLPYRYLENMPYTSVEEQGNFTENFMRALGRHYCIVHESVFGSFFYEPKKVPVKSQIKKLNIDTI